MKRGCLYVVIAVTMICACNSKVERPGFDSVTLSDICNSEALKDHESMYPHRWEAAYGFLMNTDLDTISVGEYELLPNREVYAIVSEYEPRREETCRYESHKEYIDLQYIISGVEKMGVTRDTTIKVVEPFVPGADIAFYDNVCSGEQYEQADPSRYYVFFPEDIHRPSIKIDGTEGIVRKVVVKIKA